MDCSDFLRLYLPTLVSYYQKKHSFHLDTIITSTRFNRNQRLTIIFPFPNITMNCLLSACSYLDDEKTYSRERNKMHARKTRQRKKEQMKTLEKQVEVLKLKQVDLKGLIEEKNTANILVELYSKTKEDSTSMDPRIEELLKRKTEDIPDSTKVPELPALILPGHHSNRRGEENAVAEYPNDGIDYELLAKDRATCNQSELDRIRRERNRMHAKRTRDRKRIFVEEMESIIKELERENKLLRDHFVSISDSLSSGSGENTPCLGRSPEVGPLSTPTAPMPAIEMLSKACESDIAKLFSGSKRKADVYSPLDFYGDGSSTASTSSLSTQNFVGNDTHPQTVLNEATPDSKRSRCLSDLS
jgi:hypothetical protein